MGTAVRIDCDDGLMQRQDVPAEESFPSSSNSGCELDFDEGVSLATCNAADAAINH
jgi:hypothetical protein